MAIKNKAFHLSGIGRRGDHEMLVLIPEPVAKRDPIHAVVQVSGHAKVSISIVAWELEAVVVFLSEVVAELRAMEAVRAVELSERRNR